MNVKRFTARTSRDALALVRQAFGDDAVVMSTRPCAEGVEVLAMAPESVQQLERVGVPSEPLRPQANIVQPRETALPAPASASKSCSALQGCHKQASSAVVWGSARPLSLLWLVRPHIVLFPDLNTVVTEYVVRGRDVKEELWHAIFQRIVFDRQLFLFGRAWAQNNLLDRAAIQLRCGECVNLCQRLRDAVLQIVKTGLCFFVGCHFKTSDSHRNTLGKIAGNLNLAHQRQHVWK